MRILTHTQKGMGAIECVYAPPPHRELPETVRLSANRREIVTLLFVSNML